MSVIVDYDENWPSHFQQIKNYVLPSIAELISGIEHVGSTSVPGLAAKPVIDVDVIYESDTNLPEIIRRLEKLGYQYQGNKGIEGREAFKAPAGSIKQHFYVCRAGCLALRNHLQLRDHLLKSTTDRDAYSTLKKNIAPLYEIDPEAYVEAKTEFILSLLKRYSLSEKELSEIEAVNIRKKK